MRNAIIILAAAAGLAVTAGATPAQARDSKCEAAAAEIRAALGGSDGEAARTAARRLALGEKLCAANNRRAAIKEFKVAQKALGLGASAQPEGLASAD